MAVRIRITFIIRWKYLIISARKRIIFGCVGLPCCMILPNLPLNVGNQKLAGRSITIISSVKKWFRIFSVRWSCRWMRRWSMYRKWLLRMTWWQIRLFVVCFLRREMILMIWWLCVKRILLQRIWSVSNVSWIISSWFVRNWKTWRRKTGFVIFSLR